MTFKSLITSKCSYCTGNQDLQSALLIWIYKIGHKNDQNYSNTQLLILELYKYQIIRASKNRSSNLSCDVINILLVAFICPVINIIYVQDRDWS